MPELSKIQAIWKAKCPRCRQGDLFQYPMVRLDKFTDMYSHCPHCHLRYHIEPGFFYGAMYVSYAFSVAIVMVCAVFIYFLVDKPSVWFYLVIVTIALSLAIPFSFRYGRVLWLYWFGDISYKLDN